MVVGRDTFAFPNELKWAYTYNPETGRMEHHSREPAAQFANRCVPMVRAARQFYFHAEFQPKSPAVNSEEYARLVREVLTRNPRRPERGMEKKVIIPGYTNLYDFSAAHSHLLQKAIGGSWQSYVQLSNARMVFPFSRRGQQKLNDWLCNQLSEKRPVIVHVVTFPRLALNHTILLTERLQPEGMDNKRIGASRATGVAYYRGYDPNTPERPILIWYQKEERQFYYPRTEYFEGGPVNVYQIMNTTRY